MCLYSYKIKPFVCDKDIVVYKLLKVNDNEFKTFYQDTSVSVDEVIKANGTLTEIPLDYSNNKIGKGVIHAYIRNNIKCALQVLLSNQYRIYWNKNKQYVKMFLRHKVSFHYLQNLQLYHIFYHQSKNHNLF